jgi:exoribonuclease R
VGRQPADVEIRCHPSIIHSSAELSYSQVRARAPIDPRGV